MTFNLLCGFVVLLHDRRQVVHFNVTAHPTAELPSKGKVISISQVGGLHHRYESGIRE